MSLSFKAPEFSLEALSDFDASLAAKGLRKQVRSVVVAGKEYATTYEAPHIEKGELEKVLAPLAERHNATYSVDVEESVSFP